jgi:hypothetical protein
MKLRLVTILAVVVGLFVTITTSFADDCHRECREHLLHEAFMTVQAEGYEGSYAQFVADIGNHRAGRSELADTMMNGVSHELALKQVVEQLKRGAE